MKVVVAIQKPFLCFQHCIGIVVSNLNRYDVNGPECMKMACKDLKSYRSSVAFAVKTVMAFMSLCQPENSQILRIHVH